MWFLESHFTNGMKNANWKCQCLREQLKSLRRRNIYTVQAAKAYSSEYRQKVGQDWWEYWTCRLLPFWALIKTKRRETKE